MNLYAKKGIAPCHGALCRDHIDSSLEHHINYFLAKPKNHLQVSRGKISEVLSKLKVTVGLALQDETYSYRATSQEITQHDF